MTDKITTLIEGEIEDEEPIGFLEWAGSLLNELVNFGREGSQDSGNCGPVGCSKNRPTLDQGTLVRSQCRPPGTQRRVVRLDPIVLTPIRPLVKVEKNEKFEKKFKIGADVYWELGLAGQIAEKFLKLPYRNGRIKFKSGKLDGKGLVCSSFAKIFGALWFAGDPTQQEQPIEHTLRAKARRRRIGEGGKEWKIVASVRNEKGEINEKVIGESDSEEKAKERARLRTVSKNEGKTVSSAQVYVGVYGNKFGGSLVNVDRLKLNKLIEVLKKDRLYAVVKYGTRTGESRGHVLFLIFSKSIKEWVMIHSTGWARKKGGRGPGPGIYKIPRNRKGAYRSKGYYQAWDWGLAYRPRNPDINRWRYVP